MRKSISILTFLLFSIHFTWAVSNLDTKPFVVVIDAGHGGKDPGNVGNGYIEKNIALNIALAIGSELASDSAIKVVYTRDNDTFVSLEERGAIANRNEADLFLSIHCDAHTSNAYGAGTFVLGLHASEQNFKVAKRENSVIYLEDNFREKYAKYDIDSPESLIGLTVMQEEHLEKSIQLASLIQNSFTRELNRKDRKVKQAGFIVLHQTFMPSVLVETGFLTNKKEGSYLNSKKGQIEMGRSIAQAVLLYKKNFERNSVFSDIDTDIIGGASTDETIDQGEIASPTIINSYKELQEAKEKNQEIINSYEDQRAQDKIEEGEPEIDKIQKSDDQVLSTPPTANDPEEITKESTPTEETELAVEETETEDDEESTDSTEVKEEEEQTTPTEETSEQALDSEKEEALKKVNETLVTFKVQIMARKTSMAIDAVSDNFNGLPKISTEQFGQYTRYMAGDTHSYASVKRLLERAKLSGYADAYIVGYRADQRISITAKVKREHP
jgi:N-acetylmuramoyl-L-alanine amidase